MKHLEDNNISYWAHWRFAMKVCLALYIHAWIPSIFITYASDKLCKK